MQFNKPTFSEKCPTTGKRIGGMLENWSLHCWNKSTETYAVYGNIFGDPDWYEGMYLHTLAVVKLDEENGTVETMNTIYKLGKKYVPEENE
jgi:hypothetical protein